MYTIHTIFHFEFRSLPVKWSKVERWINSQLNRLLPHLSFSKRNQAKLFCLCCLLLQVVLVPLFFSVDNSNVLVDKGLINRIYRVCYQLIVRYCWSITCNWWIIWTLIYLQVNGIPEERKLTEAMNL